MFTTETVSPNISSDYGDKDDNVDDNSENNNDDDDDDNNDDDRWSDYQFNNNDA